MVDGATELASVGSGLQVTIHRHTHHHYGDQVSGDKVGRDKQIDASRSASSHGVLIEGDVAGDIAVASRGGNGLATEGGKLNPALRAAAVIAICVAAILFLLGLTTEALAGLGISVIAGAAILAT